MPASPESPVPPHAPPRRGISGLRRFLARDARGHLWAVLDFLDERRALKRTLLVGLPVLAVAVGFGIWGYQGWVRNNAIHIARQWLDANRLDRASIAVRDALANEPDMPASWRLASELAWRKGNRAASVEYARKAAAVGRYGADDVLAWAEASLLSDDTEQAKEAETFLEPASRESPRALRVEGEIARRGQHFEKARDAFEAALKGDTAAGVAVAAVDEIPLGIVCLQTGLADDRARGRSLLARWASDPGWGTQALRALLADAMAHRDRGEAIRLAEDLRKHPRCTLGDIPTCLQALAAYDTPRYHAMLAPLEEKSRADPNQAAQLVGWLTQVGQGADAARWGESLDPAIARRPPVAQTVAEALRATGRWSDLEAWVERVDWGRELGFVGMAYHMVAERRLGHGPAADALWQSLYSDGRLSAAHALFIGDSLYAWGYPKEAADLLWAAADRPDLAFQAVGSLARLYQVQRDAEGEYRAFRRLNEMRPSDRKIANNFAYFAALTDLGSQSQVQRIAADNFNHEPDNPVYRSTYAFVLAWSGQGSEAMALIQPVSRDWKASPAVAFAYGAALASVGRKSEAKEVFDSLAGNLDPRESEWIASALR